MRHYLNPVVLRLRSNVTGRARGGRGGQNSSMRLKRSGTIFMQEGGRMVRHTTARVEGQVVALECRRPVVCGVGLRKAQSTAQQF
jgi:hypothetical protein